MKNYLSLILVALVCFLQACKSVEAYNQEVTEAKSVEDLREDVEVAYATLMKLHPNIYQYRSQATLDSAFTDLKKRITKPMTPQEFYNELAPVTALIGQGHLSIIRPYERLDKEKQKFLKDKRFEFWGVDYAFADDKLIVDKVRNYDTLLIGSTLLKVEYESTEELMAQMRKNIASDGYNTTFYNRLIASRFHTLYRKEKGFVDSLEVTFSKHDSLFTKTFRIVKRDSSYYKKEEAKDSSDIKKLTKSEKKILKQKAKEKREFNKVHDYIPSLDTYVRNFEFIGKDSSVAYMRISNFTSGKFEPFYEKSFDTIQKRKTENLIIDLRGNTGGSIEEISELYAYLVDEPFQFIEYPEVNSRSSILKTMISSGNPTGLNIFGSIIAPPVGIYERFKVFKKDGKLYYKLNQARENEPKEDNFKGKLYVLIDGASFSASSILSTNLKATKRATFIGEETGGAFNGTVAGMFKRVKLPNSKIQMRVGLMQIEAPYKTEPDGYGIYPDVEILPTANAVLEKRDQVLEYVLSEIENLN